MDIRLVPSLEPTEANITAHSRMASLRAIENGVSIFRPTSQGISQEIDPYGRTLASMDARRVSERVFVVQVPNHRVTTLYSVVGELFGWLAVAGFLFINGWATVRGRKERAAGSQGGLPLPRGRARGQPTVCAASSLAPTRHTGSRPCCGSRYTSRDASTRSGRSGWVH